MGWSHRGQKQRQRARRVSPQLRTLEVTTLERRDLMAVNGGLVDYTVTPQIVPNLKGGPQVPVLVQGTLDSTHPQAPSGLYFTTDEYRADEPRGSMPLVPLGPDPVYKGNYKFAFRFTFTVQAQRSTNTYDGRHYYLFVGATDYDGTGGKEVAILVPKDYATAVKQHAAHPQLVLPTFHRRTHALHTTNRPKA